MQKFSVEFTDKQSKDFSKRFIIEAQNEPTAWQWVEKQREVFQKEYVRGEVEMNDPRKWKVSIAPVETKSKPAKESTKE